MLAMETDKVAEAIYDCFGPAQDVKCSNLIDALAVIYEGGDCQCGRPNDDCLLEHFDRAKFERIAKEG